MKRRPIMIMLIGVVVLFANLAIWRVLESDPEYNGRPLSYWVDKVLVGDFGKHPMEALKAIGPAAAHRR